MLLHESVKKEPLWATGMLTLKQVSFLKWEVAFSSTLWSTGSSNNCFHIIIDLSKILENLWQEMMIKETPARPDPVAYPPQSPGVIVKLAVP